MAKTPSNNPSLMPLSQAVLAMTTNCDSITETDRVATIDAFGRVLAAPVLSNINVPPFDNSAMDGYAFDAQQMVYQGTSFALCGSALAGRPYTGTVPTGSCVRITTGATLPEGTNTVMMQENVKVTDQRITLNNDVMPGNSVRKAGEDIAIGEQIIAAGKKLTAADLALLASVGVAQVNVVRKIKVAIIATGDELIEPGKALEFGQIYESNRYALHGLLSQHSVEIQHCGIVEDNLEDIQNALLKAAQSADVLLTCGGVSVGDADFVKQVLARIGQIDFWKVAIKPGKPFAFGKIGNAIFCGLPGNPVSSYVTFEQLVVPLLNKLQGIPVNNEISLIAKCSTPVYKRPGRADFQRGVVTQDEQGTLWVTPHAKQGSGVMTSIANANCYLLLEQDQGNLPVGADVRIELF
ncbi:molybdopterin molybdotransferase MoeA [Aliiglaciecola litoralis]|uniref:Molybdopterin molybdenumtransferase n=1 Tax=Aliiglaciecola litoralis TaxID=582857 RepID=A0ABN1LCU6_9ALTE